MAASRTGQLQLWAVPGATVASREGLLVFGRDLLAEL